MAWIDIGGAAGPPTGALRIFRISHHDRPLAADADTGCRRRLAPLARPPRNRVLLSHRVHLLEPGSVSGCAERLDHDGDRTPALRCVRISKDRGCDLAHPGSSSGLVIRSVFGGLCGLGFRILLLRNASGAARTSRGGRGAVECCASGYRIRPRRSACGVGRWIGSPYSLGSR